MDQTSRLKPYLYVAPLVALLLFVFGYPLVQIFEFSLQADPRHRRAVDRVPELPAHLRPGPVLGGGAAQPAAADRHPDHGRLVAADRRSCSTTGLKGWKVYRIVDLRALHPGGADHRRDHEEDVPVQRPGERGPALDRRRFHGAGLDRFLRLRALDRDAADHLARGARSASSCSSPGCSISTNR